MRQTLITFILATAFLSCSEEKKDSKKVLPTSAVVAVNSSYVLQGDTFFAQVVPINSELWDNQLKFENTGEQISKSHWENGILKVAIKTSEMGLHHFSGNFKVKTDRGDTLINFSSEFMVAKPHFNVVTKCLIKDIENPIFFSIPGFPPSSIELSANDAEIKHIGGDKYTITPHKKGVLTLSIKTTEGPADYDKLEFEVYEKK